MQGVAHSQKSFPLWYLAWLKICLKDLWSIPNTQVEFSLFLIFVLLSQYFTKTFFCKVCLKNIPGFLLKSNFIYFTKSPICGKKKYLFIVFWRSKQFALFGLFCPIKSNLVEFFFRLNQISRDFCHKHSYLNISFRSLYYHEFFCP